MAYADENIFHDHDFGYASCCHGLDKPAPDFERREVWKYTGCCSGRHARGSVLRDVGLANFSACSQKVRLVINERDRRKDYHSSAGWWCKSVLGRRLARPRMLDFTSAGRVFCPSPGLLQGQKDFFRKLQAIGHHLHWS